MSAVPWSFLTNHARVLLCIAEEPTLRLREIGERVGVTERAVYRIVNELVDAGYVSRQRSGRRNRYTVHREMPLPDHISRAQPLGELLAILTPATGQPDSARSASDHTANSQVPLQSYADESVGAA